MIHKTEAEKIDTQIKQKAIKDNFIIDSLDVRFSWTIVNEILIELRKRSVDVDNLIEAGLTIDKTTLK